MVRNRTLLGSVLSAGFLLFLMAGVAGAETITLQDGRVIQGQLTRQGGNFLIQPDQGASFTVPVSDVVSISLSGPANPQQDAIDQWQYLQYQIPEQSDLGKIIGLLQDYIKQYPNSPNLSAAQKALTQYQVDQASGYVKFGGKWISQSDAKNLEDQVDAMIADAVKAYRVGNLTQAQTDAQQVLAINPTGSDALNVVGIVQYRQNNLQNALIQFNTILKTDPNNVIALNNAAIIYYQLSVNVQLRSLIDYQTALNLASGNRLLLDNIAVALQSYQGDTKIPVYINLEKSFTIADQQMQIIMAKQNLYRSGAVWVNSDMKRQIDAQEEAFQKQKEILQTSYDNAQNSLTGVNNQLNALAQQIPQMQQNIQTAEQPTVVTGSNGQTYFQPANNQLLISQDQQQLAQMQQQQQNDQTQQVQLQTQIQTIQIAAKRLMQSNASMGFSGEQLMMLPGDLVNVPPPLPVSLLSNTQNSAGGPGN